MENSKTLGELLPLFYRSYNLEHDGGYIEKKVKIKVSSHFYFYIPNSNERRRCLLKHDLHHIITNYKSDFKGETEIGAWEIASGCNDYIVAWVLDMYSMAWGFLFNLPGIFRAFLRGNCSKNLYNNIISNEQALNCTIIELQNIFEIPDEKEIFHATVKEYLLFIFWVFISGVVSLISILLLPLIIIYNIILFIKKD